MDQYDKVASYKVRFRNNMHLCICYISLKHLRF